MPEKKIPAALNLSGAGHELPVVRHLTIARRLGVPAAAAVLGALVATPALADVTVSPQTAPQGSGQNLTFHVTNTGDKPVGTVVLRMPADTSIAELYPLSVDDWAPRIEMRKLATPLATIHGGTPATETAASITWLAVQGRELKPGASTDLRIAAGPLPTLTSMQFLISTTYTDGKPGPVMPPAALKLTPAAPGAAPAGHHGGGTTTATGSDQLTNAEQAALQQALAESGGSFWAKAGWVVAGLVLLAGVAIMLRGRHRATEDDDEGEPDVEDDKPTATETTPAEEKDEKEPVAAGSKWSYKG